MGSSNGYLRRLVTVKCSCGNMENYLNVETDHGVIWYAVDEDGNVSEERPLMNANDHEWDVNIVNFGRCNSPSNQVFGGKRSFQIGSLMDAFGTAIGACDGYLCTPYCSQPWLKTAEDVLLDGAPAITYESQVTCYYGGIITMFIKESDG